MDTYFKITACLCLVSVIGNIIAFYWIDRLREKLAKTRETLEIMTYGYLKAKEKQ